MLWKLSICAGVLFLSAVGAHAEESPKGERQARAEAVSAACASDGQAAGCGDKKVGSGLLRCLHAYREEHKDFKISDACKEAMKKARQERKEKRHGRS